MHSQNHQLVHLVVRTHLSRLGIIVSFSYTAGFFSGITKPKRSEKMTEVAHCQTLEIQHKSCSSTGFKISPIVVANLLLPSVITKQTQSTTHVLHQIKKLIS